MRNRSSTIGLRQRFEITYFIGSQTQASFYGPPGIIVCKIHHFLNPEFGKELMTKRVLWKAFISQIDNSYNNNDIQTINTFISSSLQKISPWTAGDVASTFTLIFPFHWKLRTIFVRWKSRLRPEDDLKSAVREFGLRLKFRTYLQHYY